MPFIQYQTGGRLLDPENRNEKLVKVRPLVENFHRRKNYIFYEKVTKRLRFHNEKGYKTTWEVPKCEEIYSEVIYSLWKWGNVYDRSEIRLHRLIWFPRSAILPISALPDWTFLLYCFLRFHHSFDSQFLKKAVSLPQAILCLSGHDQIQVGLNRSRLSK